MRLRAEIPYGVYWSTPFLKWQGKLRDLHAIRLAAHIGKEALAAREIDGAALDFSVLGMTVFQKGAFYGAPWLSGMMGLNTISGPTISQACATGVRSILTGAMEIESGMANAALILTCDRISNGPHITYPSTSSPGGLADHENPVIDNINCDPLGGHSMLTTAENVARKHGVSTAEQHEVVLRRTAQYRDALTNDRAFQRRYMTDGYAIPSADFRKTVGTFDGDEGVVLSTEEGLARLKPVMAGGTVTFGGQTHPADGNAAIVLAEAGRARAMSKRPDIQITLEGFGQSRAELAHMPEAPLEAARKALAQAGITIAELDAIKSHNPFAVNDIVFARETGCDVMAMNNFGSSLIWGHPQGPTGVRGVIELIEELVLRGGGTGLFQGCAGGDTAMAVVIRVDARQGS